MRSGTLILSGDKQPPTSMPLLCCCFDPLEKYPDALWELPGFSATCKGLWGWCLVSTVLGTLSPMHLSKLQGILKASTVHQGTFLMVQRRSMRETWRWRGCSTSCIFEGFLSIIWPGWFLPNYGTGGPWISNTSTLVINMSTKEAKEVYTWHNKDQKSACVLISEVFQPLIHFRDGATDVRFYYM